RAAGRARPVLTLEARKARRADSGRLDSRTLICGGAFSRIGIRGVSLTMSQRRGTMRIRWSVPLAWSAAVLIGVGAYAAPAVLQQKEQPLPLEGQGESDCGTEQRWQQSGSPVLGAQSLSFGACPTQGTCDEPAVRDPFIPAWNSPIRTVTLQINVICNDAGT